MARVADLVGPGVAPTATDALLRSITRTARGLFGAAACSLALLSDDESELIFTSVSGAGEADVSGLRIPSNTGIAGWVVMSGQPIAVGDLHRDPRFATDVAETTGYVPTTLLAVPVQTPERLLGVVELLDRDESRAEANRDMEMLALFADQAALAIDGERAFWDFGRLLLKAAAVRAENATLAAALDEVAAAESGDPRDVAELAALVAQLRQLGPAESRLAVAVVREVIRYAGRRDPRPA
ncbi:MAG: GAF domain-containing protein [Actinomycetota bacterium]|nr:GAF domain-containing protein [Actinomycetota bacterium]